MIVQPLDDATSASIKSAQSYRYPQTATLRPPGARGIGKVEVQVMLGNPSGACKMPAGSVTLPAWSQYVATELVGEREQDGLMDLMVRDCLLWPVDADEILSTWPGLVQPMARVLFQKIGRFAVSEPGTGEDVPEVIQAHFEEHPRATWRWVRPGRGDAFSLLLEPPRPDSFMVLGEELRKGTSDNWATVKSFVAGCVPGVFRADGTPASLEAIIAQWPGVALSLAKGAAQLGGIAAEAELGE